MRFGAWRWGALVAVAGGFLLRLWRLDGQSLWADEGATAVMAGRNLVEIWQNAAQDIHPPLYYMIESGWATLAGSTEYALRFPSVVLGTALIGVVYVLVRRLFAEPAALLAAAGTALAPYLVQYSQEARMYTQLAFLGVVAVYLTLRLLDVPQTGPDRRDVVWAALLVLVLWAGAMTQYYAAATWIVVGLIGLLVLTFRLTTLRRFLMLTAVGGASLVLYIPWLIPAIPVLQAWPAISEPFGFPELATRLFAVFTYGIAWEQNTTRPAQLVPLALLGLSLLAPLLAPGPYKGRGDRFARYMVVVLATVVPAILMWAVSLNRPSYNPKLLLPAVPFFWILLALGLSGVVWLVWRMGVDRFRLPRSLVAAAALLPLLAVAIAFSIPLQRAHASYFDDPRYARDDYRGVVQQIEAQWRPGDAVLLNAPGQEEIVRYYAGDRLPLYPLPAERPADPERTRSSLAQIAGNHPRIWTVNWATEQSDPAAIIDSWLGAHAFRAASTWFGAVRLTPYLTRVSPLQTETRPARFADGVTLNALSLATVDGEPVQSGEVLAVELRWGTTATPNANLTAFVQLLGPDGTLWGQSDSIPAAGSRPTTSWRPGESVVDRHAVAIRPGTPPGSYSILAGLYDPATGQRIRMADGADAVRLDGVRVVRPISQPGDEVVPAADRRSLEAGGLRLVGFELGKVGEPVGGRTFGLSDQLELALLWRATGPLERVAVMLEIRGTAGDRTIPLSLDDSFYPPARWERGELVRTQFRQPLDLAPGRYQLRIGVASQRADLASIDVRP